jgi:hypothetical protein
MVAATAQKEPQLGPIRLHYPQLRDDPASVSSQIKQAFGSDEGSLGIVVIDGEYRWSCIARGDIS